jgi:hypothetical protein
MNCMTTNMFGPHIWGFKSTDQQMKIARKAGWSRADLVWERLMEAANQSWVNKNTKKSARLFRQAALVARLFFDRTDLRRATTAINLAIIQITKDHMGRATEYQNTALKIWPEAPNVIRDMTVAPRARSSLYHLRMETLHRDTFHDNMRIRFNRFAAETAETLQGLTEQSKSKHRHFARWRGERPSVYDDTRKILGACLLIIDRD